MSSTTQVATVKAEILGDLSVGEKITASGATNADASIAATAMRATP